MKKLIICNHKMSLLYDDLYDYIARINSIETEGDIIVCPSNIYLEAFLNNCDWPVGAQNIHYSTETRHTGEISTEQLKSLGVEYTIVGHAERVSEFNENKTIVNNKLIAALDSNIFPILCFGEDMDENYQEVIPKMLDAYLKDIENIQFIIFAYEPIYAISSGMLPNINKIKEITSFVSKYLEDKYNQKPCLVYGGSVNNSNINDILKIDTLNGVILGDLSSDIKELENIIKTI